MISFVAINTSPDLVLSFEDPSYIVNERDEMLEVCIQLSVASSQNRTVILSDVPGTAEQGRIHFQSCFFSCATESQFEAICYVYFCVPFLRR